MSELATIESSPVSLIREAIASGKQPEYLRELLAVRRDWEADEGRKAFNHAIAEFQQAAPIVEKGDDANGKAYAALDRIWRTVRPTFTGLGLSITWLKTEIRESDKLGLICHIEGLLGHRAGHREPLVCDIPIPDAITNGSGRAVQNKAQVMGSAISYAKRYAFCAATGLVTGDDDDGNGGVRYTLNAEEQKQILELGEAWRGTPGWSEEREGVFWRFVGTKDLGKVDVKRLPDLLDFLKRAVKKA